jgi:hypothetical protein
MVFSARDALRLIQQDITFGVRSDLLNQLELIFNRNQLSRVFISSIPIIQINALLVSLVHRDRCQLLKRVLLEFRVIFE